MANKILRIATWNANGLANHKQEVIAFLDINKVDVLLVSETHFTELTTFSIPDYTIYHTTHPDGRGHGGSAVVIRSSIRHHELDKYQTNEIQATTIQITSNRGNLNISALYSPPRHNITTDLYRQFFNTLGNKFIVGGDWNAKHTHWGSRLITTKGRNLLRALTDANYSHLSNGEPTYWPTDPRKLPDLLDFFILNGIPTQTCSVESSYELSSDHTPVIINLCSTTLYKSTHPKLTSSRTNWDQFTTYIEKNLNTKIRIKQKTEIDEAAQHFTTIIQQAAWSAKAPHYSFET